MISHGKISFLNMMNREKQKEQTVSSKFNNKFPKKEKKRKFGHRKFSEYQIHSPALFLCKEVVLNVLQQNRKAIGLDKLFKRVVRILNESKRKSFLRNEFLKFLREECSELLVIKDLSKKKFQRQGEDPFVNKTVELKHRL